MFLLDFYHLSITRVCHINKTPSNKIRPIIYNNILFLTIFINKKYNYLHKHTEIAVQKHENNILCKIKKSADAFTPKFAKICKKGHRTETRADHFGLVIWKLFYSIVLINKLHHNNILVTKTSFWHNIVLQIIIYI